MLKTWTGIIAIITILFIGSGVASAEQPPTDQDLHSLLKDAFQSQVSLGEKHHTLGEIEDILNPYFSKEYQKSFLEEHLFEEKEGYITYGTDFPVFYIPFFSYDENTKILREEEGTITVYEFFATEEDMPSLYDDHYEYVKLKETSSGWRVVEYGFEYEEPAFVKESETNELSTIAESEFQSPKVLSRLYPIGMIAFPFAFHSLHLSLPLMANQLFHDMNDQALLVAR
ncbi:DUF3993 domain-containing protein [Bacillus sp. LL01]|uniref:DUF3993 domain-containing protein n=1 Tax=Bacillus sp. LL01 TaxID=1665556 RepID=UPI00069FEA82|nr:DUF3993 domain-containing protein [Bacillus sp. LL01]